MTEDQEAKNEIARLTSENTRLRDALFEIEGKLLDARRYNNMKAFPVMKGLCLKGINIAARALGRREVEF